MKRILALSFVALTLVASACHGELNPASGPGTEYPCGIRGVVCGGHMCCPEDHICGLAGSFARCTPGDCCYDGPDWPEASRDGGAQHPKSKQFSAKK